jgi:hypothetical protein
LKCTVVALEGVEVVEIVQELIQAFGGAGFAL